MKVTPLEPGYGQLVCQVTVPQLAQGAFMLLTPRKLASASCLSLACEAGEITRATPSFRIQAPGASPGTAGPKRHPAIHPATRTGPNAIPMNGLVYGRV